MTTELHDLLDNDPAAGLRGVAALMRERATKAADPPWYYREEVATLPGHTDHTYVRHSVYATDTWDTGNTPYVAEANGPADGEHIAAADPPFVLAVADWLDNEAAKQTPTTHLAVTFDGTPMFPVDPAALAVARAYLGPR